MAVRASFTLALLSIAFNTSGAAVLAHPMSLGTTLGTHAREAARSHPPALPATPSPSLSVTPSPPLLRKPETASSSPPIFPELSNPLRRRRMAMPVVPSGDYAF